MGRRPKRNGRDVHGILLLHKPSGISSNGALQDVKKLYNANKAGHTGSLDQLASGLLPICLGEATKVSNYLLNADKRYQAECILGKTSSTGDAEGDILQERSIEGITEEKIAAVIPQFIGDIEQIPPMYSALKQQGQTLYKLARQGITVERPPRPITIYDISLDGFEGDRLKFEVHCSKGTYIRTLAEDIGEALGCGAYISQLHRTGAGPYKNMIDFETLEHCATHGMDALDRLLIPIDTALTDWDSLYLNTEQAIALRHGQVLSLTHEYPVEHLLKLFDAEKKFMGIGMVNAVRKIIPKRLINL